jgi:diguanylate cyclase
MRYKERKDHSAELLRLALAEMGRHDASFTPINFTVWYEHVAGINPRLSDAIAQQLKLEVHFSNETVERLHLEFIAGIDSSKAERISDQFRRVMQGVSDAAAHTGETAGQFGEQLTSLSAKLQLPGETAAQPQWLDAVLAGTDHMKASVGALQEQVLRSQREIDLLRADLERARIDATMCPLSRVLNRKGFDHRLADMLASEAVAGRVHCLAMFDIDHFKQVNDTHGHLMGDRVIQALGEVLRATVTLPGASAARYGGEEFAVLTPDTTPAEALQLAELLRTRTKAMKVRNRSTNEVMLTITISGGIAIARAGEDGASLIARADAALYRSKQAGRDRLTTA